MGDKIRPAQMEVTTGTNHNDTVPTLGKVEDMVGTIDSWNEVMHFGNTFTVLDTENLSATITQNDTTSNPAALIIANTGSGNDLTLPNSSYLKNGDLVLGGGNLTLGAGNNTFDVIATGTITSLEVGSAVTKVQFNDNAASVDFEIKGESGSLIFTDSSQNNVGIGSASPDVNFQLYVLGGLYTGGDFGLTATRINKGWFTNLEVTNMPTVGGTSINDNGVLSLASSEVTQLANIGATTISSTQWGYLGVMNQSVASGANVEFASIAVDGLTINNNQISTTSQNITITTLGSDDIFITANSAKFLNLSGGGIAFYPTSGGGYVAINEDGVDADFRVEGTSDANLFYADASENRIGIGTATPSVKFDVVGAGKFSSYINHAGIFAEIYVADASTAQSIATGVGYTKSTAFTSNGQSSNCSPDQANDKITITQIGRYRASGSCSGTSGKANLTWRGAAFLNNVEQDQVHWKRKMTTTTDSGDMSFTGFIDVTSVPWDLDFRLRHDDGGNQNFTIEYANLNVEYIGAT